MAVTVGRATDGARELSTGTNLGVRNRVGSASLVVRRHPRAGARRVGGRVVDAVRTLEHEVRELIRRSGLDPARDEVKVRRLVQDAVTD
jgi:hypothetical protein